MPLIDGFDDKSIQTVGHLGIVAGAYEALGIGAVIDRAIPKTRHHNLLRRTVTFYSIQDFGISTAFLSPPGSLITVVKLIRMPILSELVLPKTGNVIF